MCGTVKSRLFQFFLFLRYRIVCPAIYQTCTQLQGRAVTAEISYLDPRNELLDAVGERVAAEDEDAAPSPLAEFDRAAVVPREDGVDAVERPAGAHVVDGAEDGAAEHEDVLSVGQQDAVVSA